MATLELPPQSLLDLARAAFNKHRGVQPELKRNCSAALILRRAAVIMSCGTVDKYHGNNSQLLLAAMKEIQQ